MARGWTLDSDEKCANFNEYVANMRMAGKRPRVQFMDEKRSLDQNALSFALYKEIANQIEDQSVVEVRAECKLSIGIPILRADDEKFREIYDKSIKKTLNYEEKLQIMDYFPVTSLMDKKQFSSYIDQVIRKYSAQGLYIVMPGEGRYA